MRVQQAQLTSTPKRTPAASSAIWRNKQITSFDSHDKKVRKRKAGTVALKQIKYYQKTTDLLIRLSPFARLVREVADSMSLDGHYRWTASAIEALQHAIECYMVALFEDTNKAAVHCKRVTIRPEDMHLVRSLRGRNPNEIF